MVSPRKSKSLRFSVLIPFQSEEHNDHWHCEGPASTTEAEADSTSEVVSGSSANAASGTTGSEPAEVTDSGAGRFYAGLGAAALAVAVAL